MSGGYGTGWGSVPWGGAFLFEEASLIPDGFDIYCYFGLESSMGSILIDPNVTVFDAGGQFLSDPVTFDLEMRSGGAIVPEDAFMVISANVPQSWTMQVVAKFSALPSDFSDIVHSHIYFGTSDVAGLTAGLFISAQGIAYSGAVTLSGPDLVLGGPFQVIPGTSGMIQPDVFYTFRIAVDSSTGTAYVFVTETSQVDVIGHTLIAVVPGISYAGNSLVGVTDGTRVSVRGTDTFGLVATFDQICLGDGLVIPNLPPRADAGRDQSLRACSIGMLDGSGSFDPEGSNLIYGWRLIDAPVGSSFAFEGADGFTIPELVPTGFTAKFYSPSLGSEHLDDPLAAGDVLLVGGVAYSIVTTGVDGSGFFVTLSDDFLADNLVNKVFKVLRQRALSNSHSVNPTFLPDVPGIYRFDLVVNDGQYLSEPSVVIVNVLEGQVPKGCVPDLGFVWQYMSDFWKLVEDRERIQVLWESMAQVTAAELLTLWQVDYSKSLRDIQRTFQRRWLHYDLKLAEPLPELTAIRRVYGGVTSLAFAAAGVGGVQGTVLTIESPVHPTVQINFPLTNPYLPTQLQSVISVKLKGADARYEVLVLELPGAQRQIRISAPFHFKVATGTTVPIFTVDVTNESPAGIAGVRLSDRTYKVEYGLSGFDIKENDLFVVGGEAFKISRIVSDPGDTFPNQRVVVQTDLPLLPGAVWSIPGFVTSRLLNFYSGLVTAADQVFFEVVNAEENTIQLLSASASAACAQELTKLAVDLKSISELLSNPAYTIQLAYVLRRTRLPISELVTDIPHLQERIKEEDDGAVLRRNVDFFIEEFRNQNSIRFVSGGPSDPGDVWEEELPPERLWAEVTYLDNNPTIEGNFGIPAGLTLDQLAEIGSDSDYLSAVRGLWYSLINGPTMFNLRVGTQILLGLPFAEEAGVIEEIRTDFSPTQGRILVRDTASSAVVRSYSFPSELTLEVNPDTGVPYVIGDSVRQFAPLVSGAEVIDYIKDPTWFEGFLNQGVFFEVEKFHKFMVRVDSDAFNLSAFLFARNFILRVKPHYTFPLFVVRRQVGDTEVSVTDSLKFKARLILNEGACFPNFGATQMFDDYRAAGGGVRNQFDSDSNPGTAAPTFPNADASITWGFDKLYLCPEDEITISWCVDHPGGVVAFDSGFSFDDTNEPSYHFTATNVVAVPASPVGFGMPGSFVATLAGTVETIRLVINGTLGPDPGDYQIVVEVDGLFADTVPVTIGPFGLIVTLSCSAAVGVGQIVAARILPASGGARAPNWPYVSITFGYAGIPFEYDNGLPAMTYCFYKVA